MATKTDMPSPPVFDPVTFSLRVADLLEDARPVVAQAFDLLKMDAKDLDEHHYDPLNIRQTLIEFWTHLASNPNRLVDWQMETWQRWMVLLEHQSKKMMGEEDGASAVADRSDKRFKDPAWSESAWFDFIRQAYLLYADSLKQLVEQTEGLHPTERRKLEFYTKQITDAFAPTNFLWTNPEALKETFASGGQNIIKGLENLIHDLRAGGGRLKIRTTNTEAFEIGRNLAATPGKVVFRNHLFELIQYAPMTDKVFETPLLIAPPWINKFYILDMKPENSFIQHALKAGHTVFIMSWVNPDARHRNIDFNDYVHDGILTALDQVEKTTGQEQTNVIGYCIGGTALSMALSYLHARRQSKRVGSATFFTTLIDFTDCGDLGIFIDEQQLQSIDAKMKEQGYLDASSLQQTFSMLRANDLVWSFVINNYLMGRDPFPFDLLYWNDDSTNLPAKMQHTYLHSMYRDNLLIRPGRMRMKNIGVDLTRITTPCFFLSTREDHIAPWKATYDGACAMTKADITYVLAGSGHIAGVINPPESKKYAHWTGSFHYDETADEWLASAKQHEGSWWPAWTKWVAAHGGKKIPARKPRAQALADAPGTYVRVRAEEAGTAPAVKPAQPGKAQKKAGGKKAVKKTAAPAAKPRAKKSTTPKVTKRAPK